MTRRRLVLVLLAGALAALAIGVAARPGTAAPALSASTVSQGIRFFEARWSADPLDYLAAGQLARRYAERFGLEARLTDLHLAEAASRTAAALSPDQSRSLARLSSVLLTQHKFAPAAEAARQAVAVDSTDAEALGALADAALAAGDYPEAHRALRRLEPGKVATLSRWAGYLEEHGRWDEALPLRERICRALDRSRASSLSRAWCLTQWGRTALAGGRADQARALFGRALEVQPDYRGALEGLADLALAAGRDAAARKLYLRIATDAHPDLYLRLAGLAAREGQPEERDTWRARFAAAALDGEHEALYGPAIVQYYLDLGRNDSALAVARREFTRRPTLASRVLLNQVTRVAGSAGDG